MQYSDRWTVVALLSSFDHGLYSKSLNLNSYFTKPLGYAVEYYDLTCFILRLTEATKVKIISSRDPVLSETSSPFPVSAHAFAPAFSCPDSRIPGNGGTITNGLGGRISRTTSCGGEEDRPLGEYAGDPQQAQQLQHPQGHPSQSLPTEPPPINHTSRGMHRDDAQRLDFGNENGGDGVASSAALGMASPGQWRGQVAGAPCNHVYGTDSVPGVAMVAIDAVISQQGSSRGGNLDRDVGPIHGPGPGIVHASGPSPRIHARSRTDSGGLATLAAAATISDGGGKVAAVEGAGGTMVSSLKGRREEHSESWGGVGGTSYGGAGVVAQGVISSPRSSAGHGLRVGVDTGESPLLKRSAVVGGGAMMEGSQDIKPVFLHSDVGREGDRGACEGAAGKSAAVVRGAPSGRFEEVGEGGSSRDTKRVRTL